MTVSSAGHAYFSLKDDRSALQCVWFRDERVRSAFQPQAGLRIVVHGRIDLFEPQGALQLYVESIQPAGFGDLSLRFEALKAKLTQEGLFDSARKRPLPQRPAEIAVITSPTGVVWRDIGHVLARRWPLTRVVLVACQVQGEEAPASIVSAFRRLERWIEQFRKDGRPEDAPQLTILARGGGSLEDLWSFNDERVVRAVVAHTIPVVCGVGHEVDVTLADFAADVRAPTPSAAAELVVPDRAEWEKAFRRAADRIAAAAGAPPRCLAPGPHQEGGRSPASTRSPSWPRPANAWDCCSIARCGPPTGRSRRDAPRWTPPPRRYRSSRRAGSRPPGPGWTRRPRLAVLTRSGRWSAATRSSAGPPTRRSSAGRRRPRRTRSSGSASPTASSTRPSTTTDGARGDRGRAIIAAVAGRSGLALVCSSHPASAAGRTATTRSHVTTDQADRSLPRPTPTSRRSRSTPRSPSCARRSRSSRPAASPSRRRSAEPSARSRSSATASGCSARRSSG